MEKEQAPTCTMQDLSISTNLPILKFIKDQRIFKNCFDLNVYFLHCCVIDDLNTVKYLIEKKNANLYSILKQPFLQMPYINTYFLPHQLAELYNSVNTLQYLKSLNMEILENNEYKISSKILNLHQNYEDSNRWESISLGDESTYIESHIKLDLSTHEKTNLHPSKKYEFDLKFLSSKNGFQLLKFFEFLMGIDLSNYDISLVDPQKSTTKWLNQTKCFKSQLPRLDEVHLLIKQKFMNQNSKKEENKKIKICLVEKDIILELFYDLHTTPQQLIRLISEKIEFSEPLERYHLFLPIFDKSQESINGIFLGDDRRIESYHLESVVKKKKNHLWKLKKNLLKFKKQKRVYDNQKMYEKKIYLCTYLQKELIYFKRDVREIDHRVVNWLDIIKNWDKYRNDRFFLQLKIRDAIPAFHRGTVWKLILDQAIMKEKYSLNYYQSLLNDRFKIADKKVLDAIEKDLQRTFPNIQFFGNHLGSKSLGNILSALAAHNPKLGYVQG